MFGARCAETTSTTGTGNLTLAGAIAGYQVLSNEFWDAANTTGVPLQYWLQNHDGTEVEAGVGYLITNTTTFVRDTAPEFTLSGGVAGSGTNVTFSTGVKRLYAAPVGRGILPTQPTINTTAAASERLESTLFPVGAASTATLLNSVLYFVPFYHSVVDTVDGIAFVNTVAGTGNVVCGVYTMDPTTGRPLKLLKQGATIVSTSTGVRVSTFTAAILPPGWYFLGMHKEISDGTQRSIVGATDLTYGIHTPLGIDSSQDQITGFYETKAYSAILTASPTMSGNLAGASIAPAMWMRIA